MKKNKGLIIFIIITLISGWIGVGVDSILTDQPEGNSLGMGLWLVLPLLSAIIIRICTHDWKDCGIRPYIKGNIRWYLFAILIYPLITVVLVGIGLVFGFVQINPISIKTILMLMISSVLGGFLKNIFEEFSWRGYLAPKLIALQWNDWLVYLVGGIVWGLWHTAYYMVFLPDIYFTANSRGMMVLSGCVIMTCWSILYIEIYRLTYSVWPCVLLHTLEDAVPTALLATGEYISFSKSVDFIFNPISGVIAIIIFIAAGLWLRKQRIRREKNEAE